jgi:hypothetical protein
MVAAISANLSVLYGVNGEGLTIIQLPITSAAAIFAVARTSGKFQGQMAPTTPIGECVLTIFSSSSSCRTSSGKDWAACAFTSYQLPLSIQIKNPPVFNLPLNFK